MSAAPPPARGPRTPESKQEDFEALKQIKPMTAFY